MLLGRCKVTRQPVAAIEENMRLNLPHHFIHPFRLPAFRVEGPPAIIPQDIDRVVSRDQLPNTGVRGGDEFLVGHRVFESGDRVWLVIPVVEAVVEPNPEFMRAGGGNHLADEIPSAGPAIADMEVGEFRRIETKTLVMHCCDHHIPHAGIHRHATKPIGIEVLRRKACCQFLVFFVRDFLAVPYPLAALDQRVESIVHEEPVARLGKPRGFIHRIIHISHSSLI